MPTLILIHGAGGSAANWPYQLRRLPGWRVLAPDLHGHGNSHTSPLTSLDAYAESLWAWADDLGIGAAVLGGHSMGAAICLKMAQAAPERVNGLVLLGAASRFAVNPQLLEKFSMAGRTPEGIKSMVQWSFARRTHEALRRAYARQLADNAAGVLYADFKACAAFDFGGQAGDVRQPALVLCGAEDQMVPAALSEQLAKALPGSEVASIVGAGHMLMMEKPLEVSAAIEQALVSWAGRQKSRLSKDD
jgi:3-oxoadipate enol-lactonase/4-carboxymuconolactone decarboxylase